MRVEGDFLRSQQFYESALQEANYLKSEARQKSSKNDLAELSRLRQQRLQAAVKPPQISGNADEDESTLDVKTDPREVAFEWQSYLDVRNRFTRHNTKKSGTSIFSILLAKENGSAGKDPIRLNEVGDCNMMIGHFANAERLFRQALESSEEADSLLLASLDRLAQSQWAQGQLSQALDTSSKALSLSQKYAPEKYSAILKLHRVQILLECDKFEEGEKLCHEVIENKNAITAENSWYPLLLLGQCQLEQQKYDKALENLKTSLRILEKNAPPYDMKVNRVCLALGETYALTNRKQEGKEMFSRAIDIFCRNGGSHRTNLDTLAARQGHQYSSVNKYDVAEFCYRWAQELREAEYGKNHYKTAVMLFHQANAWDHMGDHSRATAIRTRAKSMTDGREAKESSSND